MTYTVLVTYVLSCSRNGDREVLEPRGNTKEVEGYIGGTVEALNGAAGNRMAP